MGTVKVSIIILSFNSARYLRRCIESLVREVNCLGWSSEVIVVDNGSSDESVRILVDLSESIASVKPIFLERNRGTTISRNIALRMATGSFVVILDSDVEVQKGNLCVLVSALEADSGIGIAAPRLVYPSGRTQLSGDVFPTFGHKVNRFVRLRALERGMVRTQADYDLPVPVDYAISAFWVMRREMIGEVGVFDEAIFYSPEDVDYCIRVWLKGYKVVIVNATSAVHSAQEMSRGLNLSLYKFHHVLGLIYLFRKHGYCFSRRGLLERMSARTEGS